MIYDAAAALQPQRQYCGTSVLRRKKDHLSRNDVGL
jgi:hypothetical protein